MKSHADRITSLKWNNHILASGSRRGDLFLHDVRIAEHVIAKLEGHSQELCGMAWSPESSCHTLGMVSHKMSMITILITSILIKNIVKKLHISRKNINGFRWGNPASYLLLNS